MRVLAGRLQPHQVDDVDHPDLQVGQVPAQDVGGGEHLQGRHVARAGQHDVGLGAVPESLLAHSQIPAPRVQCSTAASMSSQSGLGCLPATITLT